MLSAYFEVKSSISNSGFAKASKKSAPKPAPRRKAAAVEAAEPDETTAVRHARVRDVDDDLRGFTAAGIEGSSVTSASSSLVRGSTAADDVITEDKWEHLWDDKACGDDDDCDLDDDCEIEDPDEDIEQTVLLRDPAADDSDYGVSLDQPPSQLNASPTVFRKSLERKASSAGMAEYTGPKLTLEDDDF